MGYKDILWNVVIVLLVGGMMLLTWDRSLEREEFRVRMVSMNYELQQLSHDLDLLESRSTYWGLQVDLLSEQCEITLDLLVTTDRSGWWNISASRVLTQLQRLKKERKELKWMLNTLN